MEKRAFIAVAISIAFIMAYYAILSKLQPTDNKRVTPTTTTELAQVVQGEQAGQEPVSPQVAAPQTALAKSYEFDTDKFRITFTNIGGNISEIYLKDYNAVMPGSSILSLEEFNNLVFDYKQSGDAVVLTYQDDYSKIEKIFSFHQDSYLFEWEFKIQNLTDKAQNYNLHIANSIIDLSKLAHAGAGQRYDLLEYSISLPDNILRKSVQQINGKRELLSPGAVDWSAIRTSYFSSIIKPDGATAGYFTKPAGEKKVATGIVMDIMLQANASSSAAGKYYYGPQDVSILKSYNLGLEKVVSFGRLTPVSLTIIKFLGWSHRLVPNWGVSIIFLSILISLVMGPLTYKSLKSMKEMQTLQPEIEKLRKAYKDQPQKLNKAIMDLYKEHKVNPFGGCLPMFLQLPIFVGLYLALSRSIDLRGASFLWIKDLTQPDRLVVMKNALPVVGSDINLLPILMAIAMFFQQKMSSASSPSTSAEQQRMMMILFPIIFTVIFYNFPSGLTLYWTCYTIISLVVQKKLLYKQKG